MGQLLPTADEFRQRALDLYNRARTEPSRALKLEFEKLAVAYMQLAEISDDHKLFDPLVSIVE